MGKFAFWCIAAGAFLSGSNFMALCRNLIQKDRAMYSTNITGILSGLLPLVIWWNEIP